MPPNDMAYVAGAFLCDFEITSDRFFPGVRRDSYNSLLVCHNWFWHAALHTPELWTSWGNDLKDFKRRYLHFGISAFYLVLDEWDYEGGTFDGALGEVLKDRLYENSL